MEGSDHWPALFAAWADEALGSGVPDTVVAFCFNLAETMEAFVVEVVGSTEFSSEDPDWPCEEAFRAAVSDFAVPYAQVGREWEPMLVRARGWIQRYVDDHQSAGADRLRGARAVATGFVDGELEYIRP